MWGGLQSTNLYTSTFSDRKSQTVTTVKPSKIKRNAKQPFRGDRNGKNARIYNKKSEFDIFKMQ